MKVNLEFNLPDEKYDYLLCVNAKEMHEALVNIVGHVRSVRKGYIAHSDSFEAIEAIADLIPHKALDDIQ